MTDSIFTDEQKTKILAADIKRASREIADCLERNAALLGQSSPNKTTGVYIMLQLISSCGAVYSKRMSAASIACEQMASLDADERLGVAALREACGILEESFVMALEVAKGITSRIPGVGAAIRMALQPKRKVSVNAR